MGNTDEMKGRVKEAAGDLTNNDRLKNEGKIDRAKAGFRPGSVAIWDAA